VPFDPRDPVFDSNLAPPMSAKERQALKLGQGPIGVPALAEVDEAGGLGDQIIDDLGYVFDGSVGPVKPRDAASRR
jgi:hypothetical protein